jgi:hypothetical protein
MKNFLIVFFILNFFSCTAQKKNVKFQINQTRPYCSGARPSEEMLEKARIPQPYANKTLIFISEGGKLDSVKTNANGFISLKLTKGTYRFFEPWKFYKKTPDGSSEENYDTLCLKETRKKEDLKVVFSGKKTTVENYIAEGKCPFMADCLLRRHLPE